MRKQTTILALLLAAAMSLALFMISYQVQDLEDQLDSLNRDITRDGRAVHVLQAEWAHLNDPERLRVLADKYLGLAPVGTNQLGNIEDIPWRRAEGQMREASTDQVMPSHSKSMETTQVPFKKPMPEPKAFPQVPVGGGIIAATQKNAPIQDDAILAIRKVLGMPTGAESSSGGTRP